LQERIGCRFDNGDLLWLSYQSQPKVANIDRLPLAARRASKVTHFYAIAMPDESPRDQLLLATPRFRVVERLSPLADGGTVARQVVLHPGAVVLIPLVAGERVCLIRNERIAVGQTLVELPAGTLEPPEPPATTAIRELKEETGFTAARWRELPGFFMSPGILNERMHVFVAEGLTAGDPAREAGENIDNLIVQWDEALAMIDRGEIEDAKTIAALLMWDRVRQRD
jgi:ADP-ribose pyrophosphatase